MCNLYRMTSSVGEIAGLFSAVAKANNARGRVLVHLRKSVQFLVFAAATLREEARGCSGQSRDGNIDETQICQVGSNAPAHKQKGAA